MSYWDADAQKWVDEPPPGRRPPQEPPGTGTGDTGEPEVTLGAPDPDDELPTGPSHASILAGVVAGVVLASGLGAGIWALVRDDDGGGGGGGPVPTATAWPPPGRTDTYGSSYGSSYGTTYGTTSGTTTYGSSYGSSYGTTYGTTSGSTYGLSGGNTYNPYPTSTTYGTYGGAATGSATGSTGGSATGFVRTTDPAGFRLDVPAGWSRSTDRGSVFYKTADGRSLIQVFTLNPPGATPYDSLRETEKYVSTYKNYRKTRLGTVAGAGSPAEYEYTYTLSDGTYRHVVIHAHTAPDGRQYALLVGGPVGGESTQALVMRSLVGSFCPTGYCAG
ncbi:hypothetical protein [Streptomyces sp. UNOB3_S3]|uniref:hypothetical protein n=1 Tax=Streptomyces sp. UNOB3_S3 TaxID=2871682 RepID=UPI001E5EA886|nr:hypothetical protein [Streptomyces sp. UNOB3_S3]MCC3775242.1 hypothetical protein [Streptomyces sp. UNOB3_S3]